MKILVIGKSHSARVFTKYFVQEKNNIVFTTEQDTLANCVNILAEDTNELVEFAKANLIDLTIICDDYLLKGNIVGRFSEENLTVFAPDNQSASIVLSKSTAKKFMYKSKIPTPKFSIFDKVQFATDYARREKLPFAIKPDNHFYSEGTILCETFGAAKNAIESFFVSGNKKIVIENYIFGKEASFYVVSDGYNPVMIDTVSYYQNTYALRNPDFITEQVKQKVFNTIIKPTISGLAFSNSEYVGILGFDVILNGQNIYLLEYNSFFKDLDAEFFTDPQIPDWAKVFESAVTGSLCDNFSNIESPKEKYMSVRLFENDCEKIETVCARTANEAKERLIEAGADRQELEEALKLWKY